MARFAEYEKYDALGLGELVAKKEITPPELLEEAIARIEHLNPQVNAVVHKFFERARKEARGNLPEGPFRGVPFLIKDLMAALTGEPMRSGSRFYGDWNPPENSELVNRFLKSGVVIAGKTNTPEFGLIPSTEPELFGPTCNPWNLLRTTGGSSGGAAASVASRFVPMASGGDGGGSIRIPASCCGIFGMKPSRGRTPTGPYEAESWHGFTAEHVLTRSVRDSAAMLDATCGPYVGDLHSLPKPSSPFLDEVSREPGRLRVAASAEPFLPGKTDPDVLKAFEETVKLLKDLGHEVVEARPGIDGLTFARSFLVMVGAHVWSTIRIAEERMGHKARRKGFEGRTWLASKMGNAMSAGEYALAVGRLQEMARGVHRFTESYDVILNPTVSKPPPPLGFLNARGAQAAFESLAQRLPLSALMRSKAAMDQAAADTFAFIPWTPIYNVSGQPSMSVPLHWNKDNLPIGMMFTAKYGDEATLFRLAGQLEKARPWADKKPPVCG